LVYTDQWHQYTLDGRVIPGVTKVIGKATEKPGLAYAAAREAALWAAHHLGALDAMGRDRWVLAARDAHREVWNASAERGHRIHRAALQLVGGQAITPKDPDTGEPWPEDEMRSAYHLARFMDEWHVEPLAAERPVFHERDLWAGTVDLVAQLRGGDTWVLDYKTGSGVYPEHALQLATYRHATHLQAEGVAGGVVDLPMIPTDRCAVVHVRPDGYKLIPTRSDEGLYDVFRHMLPVAEWAGEKPAQSVFAPITAEELAS
jgi:hypothetical protein